MDIKELEKLIRKFVVLQSPNQTHTLSAFYDFAKTEAVKDKEVYNSKDPAPMIGLNPFKRDKVVAFDDHLYIESVSSRELDRKFNLLLNGQVNEFEHVCD